MEVVEMKIQDIINQGVYAISLVQNPAIQENFIYLSGLDEPIKLAMTEQGMVYGMALVPDKKIDRRNAKGEIYQIFFTEETIKETAHLFLSRNQNNNATLGHEQKAEGVSFVESWIVEDPKNDKANALGLEAVKGAWVVGAKINDEQTKQDIKDGKFKGFSIEGKYEPVKTLEEKLGAILDKFEKQINK
jgi:hypothetical protein